MTKTKKMRNSSSNKSVSKSLKSKGSKKSVTNARRKKMSVSKEKRQLRSFTKNKRRSWSKNLNSRRRDRKLVKVKLMYPWTVLNQRMTTGLIRTIWTNLETTQMGKATKMLVLQKMLIRKRRKKTRGQKEKNVKRNLKRTKNTRRSLASIERKNLKGTSKAM